MNSAIKDFIQEMKAQDLWEHVVLVTASDFGRTITPNSAGGTDHGSFSVFWDIVDISSRELCRECTYARVSTGDSLGDRLLPELPSRQPFLPVQSDLSCALVIDGQCAFQDWAISGNILDLDSSEAESRNESD